MNKPVRYLTAEDVKSWQELPAKVIVTSDKGKKNYSLKLYFSQTFYQDFYLNEQQFNSVLRSFKIEQTYAQNKIKVWARLKKGKGKTYGVPFGAVDIVVVPWQVFYDFKYIRPELFFNLIDEVKNLIWEEVGIYSEDELKTLESEQN